MIASRATAPPGQRWLGYLFALAAGIGLVLSVFPSDLLLSGNVPDARLSGDVADHVIGQRAFLMDAWHWPPLQTTMLNWPTGLNIAMTDSNPLVSLLLKPFSLMLPDGFSAIQIWLAFAYLVQPVAAVFALRSAGETRLVPAAAVALFSVAMPTLLYRHTHSALSAHFVILVALGCYFRMVRGAPGRVVLPLLLLPVSLLIHPYLAVMALAVLLAAPTTLALRLDRRWLPATATVGASLMLTLLIAASFGYAATDPSGGFGEASMNLVAPFQPSYSYFLGAGVVFADATGSQYEGYQYLGIGLLALLSVALVAAFRRPRESAFVRHPGLVLACLALTVLAVSNVVYFGPHRLGTLRHMPAFLNQLRSSGRLFWPVAYLAVIGCVVRVARMKPWPLACALLLGTALLQLADAHILRLNVARDLRATAPQPIDAARLERLLAGHDRLNILPTFGCGANSIAPEFMQLLLAASRRRMVANTMYVARFSQYPNCADTATALAPLAPGELRVFLPLDAEAGPALVPDGARRCRTLAMLSVCTLDAASLDGLGPVAAATVRLGQDVSTKDPLVVPVLGPGWYRPEPDGVWSLDHAVTLAMRVEPPPSGDLLFAADVHGFTGDHATRQHVALSVNGHPVGAWDLPDRVPRVIGALIPREALTGGVQVLRFDVAKPTRPSATGVGYDFRELGLFLQGFRFDPAYASRSMPSFRATSANSVTER